MLRKVMFPSWSRRTTDSLSCWSKLKEKVRKSRSIQLSTQTGKAKAGEDSAKGGEKGFQPSKAHHILKGKQTLPTRKEAVKEYHYSQVN